MPGNEGGASPWARWLKACVAGAVLAWVGFAPAPTSAHRRADPGAVAANGLVIPALTHGEMAVVAQHAGAIRTLVADQARTDPTFRRLANFAALQRTYCLWGLVPGSLSDEDNPFNACLHAYLGALRALVVHMREMPGGAPAARLSDQMTREMVGSDAASRLCRSSGADFNTAEVIIPQWRDILGYPPTLVSFAGLALMLGTGVWALGASGTRRGRHEPPWHRPAPPSE